jgi:hypothetical protein
MIRRMITGLLLSLALHSKTVTRVREKSSKKTVSVSEVVRQVFFYLSIL